MFAASKTASVSGGYQISRSLRFNRADSAYLIRTPASAGNRKQWSWSMWFKIASVGTEIHLFGASQDHCYFKSDSTLSFNFGPTVYRVTSQVFRDVGAWMHLVVVWDSSNATVADRLRFYINGVQVTAFSTNNAVTLNDDSGINSVTAHNIGRFYGGSDYFNGYMTEINFIDGQALTASSFGETNAQTGVWQPKAYSGSYGTNGFYLNFSDNSNTTAATLGKDYSGNGNNWTPNNFSVTAGAGNDSLVDSPTSYGTDTGVGGTVRGNYCTWNPLDKNASISTLNGNLDAYISGGSWFSVRATFGMTTGKWYWETVKTTTNMLTGIGQQSASLATYVGGDANGWSIYQDARKFNNNIPTAYGSGFNDGDIVGVAFDADAGTLTFYINGVSQGVAFTGLTSGPYFPMVGMGNAGTITVNFGQRPFAYTAPSGFKALCTQNLPTPTIGATTATQAGKYFNPVLFTGDGNNPRNVTGVGFQPDFVWVKRRDGASNHFLQDAVRGVTSTDSKSLVSNNTDAETNFYTTNGGVTAFISDGFTTSGGATNWNLNFSGNSMVAWNWKANGSGSSNTAGSITSTVSANTTSGFSIVTYTGGAGVGGTIGHGLGVAPSMYIVKCRGTNSSTSWATYHKSIGAGSYVLLNGTGASTANNDMWNNTAPTSTVFSVGTLNEWASGNSSNTYVAYCFAEVEGYSKIGSYTGNGSTDGPFVFTGMRPAFILFKVTSISDEWRIYDEDRLGYNTVANILVPNASDSEAVTGNPVDILSNGFKVRGSGASINSSGQTYIYIAFASNPFKYSLAR